MRSGTEGPRDIVHSTPPPPPAPSRRGCCSGRVSRRGLACRLWAPGCGKTLRYAPAAPPTASPPARGSSAQGTIMASLSVLPHPTPTSVVREGAAKVSHIFYCDASSTCGPLWQRFALRRLAFSVWAWSARSGTLVDAGFMVGQGLCSPGQPLELNVLLGTTKRWKHRKAKSTLLEA